MKAVYTCLVICLVTAYWNAVDAEVIGNREPRWEWVWDWDWPEILGIELDCDAVAGECECFNADLKFFCCSCDDALCFPGKATVKLEGGKTITMQQVRPGDRLQTADTDGTIVYSEVRAFMKRLPNNIGTYLTLTTENGQALSLTPSHVVFSSESNMTAFSQSRFAKDVQVGDYVFTVNADDQSLTPSKVTEIKKTTMQGAYVPLTWHGTVLVDGVYASCYASFDHTLAHVFMSPMRYLPSIFDISWESEEPRWYCEAMRKIGHAVVPKWLDYRDESEWNGGLGAISASLKLMSSLAPAIISG